MKGEERNATKRVRPYIQGKCFMFIYFIFLLTEKSFGV